MRAMSVATSRLPAQAGSFAEPPRRARQLGAAGLIPFVLGAALIWLVYPEAQALVTLALAGYAACVVGFLGGVHWGLAMRAGHHEPVHFGWAVVPPLVATIGVLMPAYAGLVLLGAMLLVCYAVDRRLYAAQGLGTWLTLRFRLSTVAALCCFIGAAGT
jgi:Protein of unknown function (DUF3429)